MNKYTPTELQNNYDDNAGGLCSFLFAPIDWIQTDALINNVTNKAQTAVILISGKTFLTAKCLQDSMQFNEVQKNVDGGIMYEQGLTGVINGDTEATNLAASQLPYYEFVVIYTNRKGEKKLIGNKLCGMKFNADLSTGAKFTDTASFVISLSKLSKERAHFYDV